MLRAAPGSLALFTLTLPCALLISPLYRAVDWLFLALGIVNLIAFARVTYAWHWVVNQGTAADIQAGRNGPSGALHLLLLSGLAIAVTYLARLTGDLPFLLYFMVGSPNDGPFYSALLASLAVIWLPLLYLLAVYGLCLPRVVVTGNYGFGEIRGQMRYPRWPLMFMLAVLLAVASFTASDLRPLLYYVKEARLVSGVVGTLLCVAITFVLTAMYAVAYRDSVAPAGQDGARP